MKCYKSLTSVILLYQLISLNYFNDQYPDSPVMIKSIRLSYIKILALLICNNLNFFVKRKES